MRESRSAGPIHVAVSPIIVLMMVVVVATPLVLALGVRGAGTNLRRILFIAAAIMWAIVFVVYRAFNDTHQRRRRAILQQELANIRRARLESSSAFEDRLTDHHAILDRIAEISETLLDEGIIDPQLALRSVQLIESHAREAQIQIEDTVVEVRVETGVQKPSIEPVNARDEVEQLAAPFARRGIGIATSGPQHFAETDPSMFRLIVRSLVAGAVDRGADDIDLSVSRDNDVVVCTVSDNGPDCSRLGLDGVSALARSLAPAAGAELRFFRALGRNQFSVETPGAEPPPATGQPTAPLDVLGELERSEPRDEVPVPRARVLTADEIVTFVEDQEHDRRNSVAAHRKRELLAR